MASCKIPILETRVRFPGSATFFFLQPTCMLEHSNPYTVSHSASLLTTTPSSLPSRGHPFAVKPLTPLHCRRLWTSLNRSPVSSTFSSMPWMSWELPPIARHFTEPINQGSSSLRTTRTSPTSGRNWTFVRLSLSQYNYRTVDGKQTKRGKRLRTEWFQREWQGILPLVDQWKTWNSTNTRHHEGILRANGHCLNYFAIRS